MKVWATALICGYLAMMAACVSGGAEEERGRDTVDAPITIGVAWPFAVKQDLFKLGVALALEDINQDGGVLGRQLEAIFADDGGSVTTGKAVAQDFAENRDMVAVIGHYDSFIALPASVTYEYNDLLLISPGATNPKLTNQNFRYVFRSIPSDIQVGTQLAEIAQHRGFRRMIIIFEQSNYGRQLANAIEFRAEEIGVHIADRLSYDTAARDYRLLFTRLKLLDYDGVFFAGLGRDAHGIIKGLHQQGKQVPVLGGNGLDTAQLFGEDAAAVEGTMVLSVFHRDDPNPYVQTFNRHFTEKYDRQPDAWAAQGFDAVMLLAHAIRSAQSTRPEAIADALRTTHQWYGVTGSHSFEESGEVKGKPMVVKIARNGVLEFSTP